MDKKLAPGWKKGPLPKDTYGYGAIVTVEMGFTNEGMLFAYFRGDRVFLNSDTETPILADEILLYNNTLELPFGDK